MYITFSIYHAVIQANYDKILAWLQELITIIKDHCVTLHVRLIIIIVNNGLDPNAEE